MPESTKKIAVVAVFIVAILLAIFSISKTVSSSQGHDQGPIPASSLGGHPSDTPASHSNDLPTKKGAASGE